MTRRELKRFNDRKKEREKQAKQLQLNRTYAKVQKIIQNSQSGNVLCVSDTLNSLEKLHNNTKDLKETQVAFHAQHILIIAQGCVELKKHITNVLPGKWESWTIDNLTFIGVRTRQDAMRLVQENGVYDFTYIGISALTLILRAIKDLYPENHFPKRFHAFFDESSYPYKEYKSIRNVKKLVTAHVFEVQAKREGIKCNIDNIKALAEYPDTLNDQLIEILHQTIADGGSPDKRLERIIMGKGKLPKLTPPKKPSVLPISFDRNVAATKQISRYYHENNHKIEEIRIKAIEESVEVLTSLYWEKFTHDLTKHL